MSVESRMAERRNELFEDLVQFVEQRLMEYGEPANKASVTAPSASPSVSSATSPLAVRKMMGMLRVAARALKRRQTS